MQEVVMVNHPGYNRCIDSVHSLAHSVNTKMYNSVDDIIMRVCNYCSYIITISVTCRIIKSNMIMRFINLVV